MARARPKVEGEAAVARVSLRDQMALVAGEEANLERLREIIGDALGAEVRIRVTCPSCGEEFRPEIPDTKRQLDAAISLLEQVEGKVGAGASRRADVIVVRPPLE
jgi:hypothetical protein